MHELTAEVVSVRQRGEHGFWVTGFAAAEVAESVRAGQFVNILLRPGPLLRRPFSVYTASAEGVVEVIYKPVGEGTELLASLRIGDRASLLGPLGRPFSFDSAWGSVALVSGGLGVAPMPLAARDAKAAGLRVVWVHGARTSGELQSEWSGDELVEATDDGSAGFHGTAVAAVPSGVGAVLACGPNRMLAAVAERWPEAQVAVETYMGCGTGVCLGCAVPKLDGAYDRACKEGPVYRAAEVDWAALPSQLHYAVA
ncbi:MAG TPA: dihydroorotate dehydrogenase electron transfer subunit [Candidatus Dormibacteraeota bacterium]